MSKNVFGRQLLQDSLSSNFKHSGQELVKLTEDSDNEDIRSTSILAFVKSCRCKKQDEAKSIISTRTAFPGTGVPAVSSVGASMSQGKQAIMEAKTLLKKSIHTKGFISTDISTYLSNLTQLIGSDTVSTGAKKLILDRKEGQCKLCAERHNVEILLNEKSEDSEVTINYADNIKLMLYTFKIADKVIEIFDVSHGFKLNWTILQYKDSKEITQHSDDVSDVYMEQIYNINLNSTTYLSLSKCHIRFELSYYKESQKILLGNGILNLNKGLNQLNTYIEENIDIDNNDLCILFPHNYKFIIYGVLKCSYMVETTTRRLMNAIPKVIHPPSTSHLLNIDFSPILSEQRSKKEDSMTQLEPVSETELAAFQEGLNLVLIRNKALRTTQSEISNELKDRTTWMHEELKWRLALQEHSILSGKDPDSVKWRQWKDDSTYYVKYRSLSDDRLLKATTPILRITISELYLNPNSRIFMDDSIVQIYVEYSFLKFFGRSMETISVPKPSPGSLIKYDFKKEFYFNDDQMLKALGEHIKNNEPIVFTAISEPPEDARICQTCIEIGSAMAYLFYVIQNLENEITINYPLIDTLDPAIELGYIKIYFWGLISIRKAALAELAGGTFKIVR